MQVWGAGEDTALAPLLPELLAVLNSRVSGCAVRAVIMLRHAVHGDHGVG